MSFRVTELPESAILKPLDSQVSRQDTPLPLGNHLNWVLSGRKGQGKSSVLLSALLDQKSPWFKHYSSIHIISPTAKKDPKFQPLLDDIEESGQGAHYETLNNETVDEILQRVSEFNEKYHTKKKPLSHLCIIDDCIHLLPTSQTRKGPASRVNQLFVNNRHSKLTNVITTQQYRKINPLIRANMDLLTQFPTENAKEIESIAADFNLDHDKFVRMLSFATDTPNSFLHVNLFGHKPTYYKKFDRIEISNA